MKRRTSRVRKTRADLRGRQPHHDPQPRLMILQPDLPAMPQHDRAHQAQAQSGAGRSAMRLQAMETIEYALALCVGNTGTPIGNPDARMAGLALH